jgi:hypothetical protein
VLLLLLPAAAEGKLVAIFARVNLCCLKCQLLKLAQLPHAAERSDTDNNVALELQWVR